MDDAFLGTIMAVGFNFAPRNWAMCNGQILSVASNTALFSLLGATFGGDGRVTFGLPDLQGRTIVGAGQGPGLSGISYGEKAGAESINILTSNMPAHNHQIINGTGANNGTVKVTTTVTTVDSQDETNESDNGNNGLGTGGSMQSIYRESPSGNDHIGGVSSTITGSTSLAGSNIPVNIRNPYLGMYYCIALEGIFPSRS
jgi:microcystin-dependent protein